MPDLLVSCIETLSAAYWLILEAAIDNRFVSRKFWKIPGPPRSSALAASHTSALKAGNASESSAASALVTEKLYYPVNR